MTNWAENLGSISIGDWPGPGTMSPDNVAIMGRNQVAFLYRGTNSYYDSYQTEGDIAANKWIRYCGDIAERLSQEQISFSLVVIPNKATCLPDFYPLDLGKGITDAFHRICSTNATWLCSLLESFRTTAYRENIYRRNDTHLTSFGNVVLVKQMMRHLGIADYVDFEEFSHYKASHNGDLGARFVPAAREELRILQLPEQRVQIHEIDPPTSNHTGLTFVVENADGLHDQTVIVFGNSFFERFRSWGATPYLSRYFKRMVFKWCNHVDIDLVRGFSANHVILQTSERFLRLGPTDINAAIGGRLG